MKLEEGVVVVEEEEYYKTWGRSRSVRLRGFDYGASSVVYHVTIGARDKQRLFVGADVNEQISTILKRLCRAHKYVLIAYCLMPDHAHVLVLSEEGCSELSQLVRAFKSYSTRRVGRRLWQRGYYEHIVRKEEDVVVTAEYIINNPVRKELVKKAEGYRWAEIIRIP